MLHLHLLVENIYFSDYVAELIKFPKLFYYSLWLGNKKIGFLGFLVVLNKCSGQYFVSIHTHILTENEKLCKIS